MAFSVHVSAQNLILKMRSAQKNSLLEGLETTFPPVKEVDNHLCTADSRTTVTRDKGLFSSDPANPLHDYWYTNKCYINIYP